MERKSLDLANQLGLAKKLSESFDARVVYFRIANRSRCIEEDDVAVEVDQCAEGVHEFMLLD